MAKLAIFSALFIGLVAIATATTYTTTVVTTEVSDESNPMSQQCQKQMQKMKMNQCRMWMRQQMQGGQYEDEVTLRSVVSNPQYLEECCSELRSFDRDCRCDAIRMMMKEQQGKYGMEKMQKMMQMAENLPMMCKMKSPTQCRMRMVFV